MPKADLGDVCGRYLCSRLSKSNSTTSSNEKILLLNNERIATEHKRHTLLTQKLLFKPYKKNPLEKLRRIYTTIKSTNIDNMPANNEVLLTTFNNNTTTTTNGTNSTNHAYRPTCNGNGISPSPSPSTKSNGNSSLLMMNWELLKDRGSGLVNLGNTCFINASLQCLANTPPLVQWLLCNSHYQGCRVKLEKQFCLFCEAERIVKLIHSTNGRINNGNSSSSVGAANPNNIARRIKDISTTFKIGRQEDASEFLICLLDKIVDACLRSCQPPERLRPSSGTSYEQLCHSQTILHDLFGLVLRSRVVCSRCRHTSDTFEVQYTWIVGVRNHTDLRQSLQQFVYRETLSGENLYRCMKCKQLVPAWKRYTLHKASKILLINLKRFEFGKNSHKLSHLVRYPEHLNVSQFMSEEKLHDNDDETQYNYRLYAVLVHVGASMHSGHYFSYVRSPNNRWYKADDTTMTPCELNQVLTQHGAYILCYINEATTTTTSTQEQQSNGSSATTKSKIVYQNGKLNNSETSSYSSHQIPVQNLPKQINGQNGTMKPMSSSTFTKPVFSSVSDIGTTTNGNSLSTEKREPIVMRIPKMTLLANKSIQLHAKPVINSQPNGLPSKLTFKSNSTAVIPSTMKNGNYAVSSSTSLSSVQSTSSPLKLIIKSSTSTLNGLASISNSYNHNDDNDDDDDDDDSSNEFQPPTKKLRIEESSTVPTTSSQSNLVDEESVYSSSSTTKHKKKKKKKKSHKHHHHHKSHHHHHKRSKRDNNSRSRSCSPSTPILSSSSIDEIHRRHKKSKKHRHHKRSNSPSVSSGSSREPL